MHGPDGSSLFRGGPPDDDGLAVVLADGELLVVSWCDAAFLQKPFSPDTLAQRVRDLLDA